MEQFCYSGVDQGHFIQIWEKDAIFENGLVIPS